MTITLRVGGIDQDPIRHTVSRDGRQVDLSVKEFGVLEALLSASPAFLSAESLLEQVWDEQADPSPTRSPPPPAACAASSATRQWSARPRQPATGSAPKSRPSTRPES